MIIAGWDDQNHLTFDVPSTSLVSHDGNCSWQIHPEGQRIHSESAQRCIQTPSSWILTSFRCHYDGCPVVAHRGLGSWAITLGCSIMLAILHAHTWSLTLEALLLPEVTSSFHIQLRSCPLPNVFSLFLHFTNINLKKLSPDIIISVQHDMHSQKQSAHWAVDVTAQKVLCWLSSWLSCNCWPGIYKCKPVSCIWTAESSLNLISPLN